MSKAPEPTDVIWENLQVTHKVRRTRQVQAGLAIMCFILVTFILQSALKSYKGYNIWKYPQNQNCVNMKELFRIGNSTDTSTSYDLEEFKLFAEEDKVATVKYLGGAGYYKCYC